MSGKKVVNVKYSSDQVIVTDCEELIARVVIYCCYGQSTAGMIGNCLSGILVCGNKETWERTKWWVSVLIWGGSLGRSQYLIEGKIFWPSQIGVWVLPGHTYFLQFNFTGFKLIFLTTPPYFTTWCKKSITDTSI